MMSHTTDHPRVISVESFGFLHEVPQLATAALVVDVRKRLRDPHVDPAFRQLTGRDDAVRRKVLTTPGAGAVLEDALGSAVALHRGWNGPRCAELRILIGCQGGRHRSVVLAETVAQRLTDRGLRSTVLHHHIDMPVVKR